MLSKEDELDLLSEEEGGNENERQGQNAEAQNNLNEDDNMLSPDISVTQKLSQTQRYDGAHDRSAMASGNNNQGRSVERSPHESQNVHKLEPSVHQKQIELAMDSSRTNEVKDLPNQKKISTASTGGSQERPVKYTIRPANRPTQNVVTIKSSQI